MNVCPACGRWVVYAKTPDGDTIALDVEAPVYFLATWNGESFAQRATNARADHAATCPGGTVATTAADVHGAALQKTRSRITKGGTNG